VSDTSAYIARIAAGEDPADFTEVLDAGTRTAEQIAFSLRTNRGVQDALVSPEKTSEFANLGYLVRAGDRWLLTRAGRLMADELAEALMGG